MDTIELMALCCVERGRAPPPAHGGGGRPAAIPAGNTRGLIITLFFIILWMLKIRIDEKNTYLWPLRGTAS